MTALVPDAALRLMLTVWENGVGRPKTRYERIGLKQLKQ
jgi:hypothetical protein